MKSIVSAFAFALLASTAVHAEVSCENDRICADNQKCVDGYCKDVAAFRTHGSAVQREGASKIPDSADSLPQGRHQQKAR